MTGKAIRVGWASGDVTPCGRCSLQGQFHTRISEGVRDPLTATALALESEDGLDRTVLMSLDAVWVSDEVRAALDDRLRELLPDFDPESLVISATHTHTGPAQKVSHRNWPETALEGDVVTPEEYNRFLAERLAEIASEAWRRRAPGSVAWGYGTAVIGHNRRIVYRDGSSVMYGPTQHALFSHVEGHENHGVDLLYTFDLDQRLTGVVVNVPCPSQCTEHAVGVSADFWHETRLELRRRLGPGLAILPQCGAAGDQSPHLLLERKAEERMLRLRGILDACGGDFEAARRVDIARRIAAAVEDVLPAAVRDIRSAAVLKHVRGRLELPVRAMTPQDERLCRESAERCALRLEEHRRRGTPALDRDLTACLRMRAYFEGALEREKARREGQKPTHPVEIHAVRVGDVAMVTNRFEFFLDFGERIKARSPAEQTFIVQLAGEGTYLPTARAERGGGYGAWYPSTLFGSEAGDAVVEESLALIERLFAPSSSMGKTS